MTVTKNLTANFNSKKVESFEVIHPLYDVQEEKRRGEDLGLIKLTPTVRFSLLILRLYIITMGALLIYHVLDLSGLFGQHVAK